VVVLPPLVDAAILEDSGLVTEACVALVGDCASEIWVWPAGDELTAAVFEVVPDELPLLLSECEDPDDDPPPPVDKGPCVGVGLGDAVGFGVAEGVGVGLAAWPFVTV
jgi:hypothetical protein